MPRLCKDNSLAEGLGFQHSADDQPDVSLPKTGRNGKCWPGDASGEPARFKPCHLQDAFDLGGDELHPQFKALLATEFNALGNELCNILTRWIELLEQTFVPL